MKPLTAPEIRGNWATVLLPINDDDSIDLGRLEAEVETIIRFGVDGLYSNGTAGEVHTQSEAEFDAVNGLIASICHRRGQPFQIGVSHMSAQISLGRLERSVALAPSAVQLILPDWWPLTEPEAVTFLRRMAATANGIGLVLYNPPHAKRRLTPAEFGRLKAQVPELVGVKVLGGDAAWYAEMREHMAGLSVFVAGHNLADAVACGAHGAYSNMACLHPGLAQGWTNLMATDLARAQELGQRLQRFMREHVAPLARDGYSNTALDKFLAAVGGWADIGTRLRWPYRFLPMGKAVELRGVLNGLIPELDPWHDGGETD